MSTIFTDTSALLMETIAGITGVTLPIIGANDDGGGTDLKDGFIMVDVQYRRNDQVTINGLHPKLRLRGSIHVAICTPINEGSGAGLSIADKLHTLLSRQRFNHVYCFPGYIDTAYKVAYSKGSYWNTPFWCNFYIEEYL